MTMYTESLRAFLKPVLPFLDDDSVSEIMINGPEDIWIERKGRLLKTEARFSDEGLLGAARNMAQFVGRVLSEERPRLDARLPDGSRIHVVLSPIARKGTTISIRKFFKDKLNVDALLKFNSLTPPMAKLIEASILTKLNVIVSGGTGSGKTTLLNILSSLIPDEERILTIEDSAELQLNQSHLVPFESRPPDKFGKGGVDMGDLLHSALRLRPDRIVVGEVRGGECFHLMQAMNTGHGGSLATTHANTPTDTLRRLEALCLMSPIELPMVAVRAQVASAINLIVCCERLHDGSRKVTAVSEVLPLNDKGEYRTQDIFVFSPVTKDAEGHIIGYHAPTGIVPHFARRARAHGFTELSDDFFDPATYGVPPPPVFAVGEQVQVRWAPSLKHREKNLPDPDAFSAQWSAFERKLKEDFEAAQAKASAAPSKPALPAPSAAPSPAAAPPASPPSAAATGPSPAGPKPRPAAPPPATVKSAVVTDDDDKTPPPTRNPMADEAKVELSEDLLRETHGLVEESPPRRTTGSRPVPRPGEPLRRPLRPEEPRPAPSEKTQIRAVPDKPRR